MPFRGDIQRVPTHNHGSRSLGFVKPQQLISKADNRACPPGALSRDRLWQSVIRAMGKGVAIDDKQRPEA
jgi:hypothetical protein